MAGFHVSMSATPAERGGPVTGPFSCATTSIFFSGISSEAIITSAEEGAAPESICPVKRQVCIVDT